MAYEKKKYVKGDVEEKPDFRDIVIKATLENMKACRDGDVKYKRGWFICTDLPYNPITGKGYSHFNNMALASYGFSDPRFIPAGQLQALYKETNGAVRVKKGEKCCYAAFAKEMTKDLEEVDEATGENKKSVFKIFKAHPIYNVSQLEGLDIINERFPYTPKVPMNEIEEDAFVRTVSDFMISTGLKIETHALGQAYYMPGVDTIKLPDASRFESNALFNRTKLHEIGHATGHPSRENRPQTAMFGTKDYAFEELVAEMFSVYMGMQTGIPYDRRTHDNHGSYMNSWIERLSSDETKARDFFIKASKLSFEAYNNVISGVDGMKKMVEDKQATEEKPMMDKPAKKKEKIYLVA